jgi:hypothetical protein
MTSAFRATVYQKIVKAGIADGKQAADPSDPTCKPLA